MVGGLRAMLLVAVLLFGCGLTSAFRQRGRKRRDPPQWTQPAMQCEEGPAAKTTESMTAADYDAAYASIATRYHSLPAKCNGTFCPQADWSGCVLRAAGHDFMDFDGTSGSSGGSDGCLDLHDADNAGLHECLYLGEFGVSINQAYQEHCKTVSLADFLVIAGEAVMHLTRQNYLQEYPKGEPIDFKSSFRFGRTTAEECAWARGRLPNPERSCTAVKETFLERMGLSWEEAAALTGVHTLGRAKVENSGYDGFWSDATNSRWFNNNFYHSLLNKGWKPRETAPERHQWFRSDLGQDTYEKGMEMMLNTDLCLAYTLDAAGEVELNAEESLRSGVPCCTWRWSSDVELDPPKTNYHHPNLDFCGMGTKFPTDAKSLGPQGDACCWRGGMNFRDCADPADLKGPAYEAVKAFSLSESAWLAKFMVAWKKATENGATGLKALQ